MYCCVDTSSASTRNECAALRTHAHGSQGAALRSMALQVDEDDGDASMDEDANEADEGDDEMYEDSEDGDTELNDPTLCK